MEDEDQFTDIPAYCIRCGGAIEILKVAQKRDHGSGKWRCTSCGHEDSIEWVPLTAVPDNRFYRIFQSLRQWLQPRRRREENTQRENTERIIAEKGLSGLIGLAHFPVLGLSAESDLLPYGFSYSTKEFVRPVESIELDYFSQYQEPRDMLTIDSESTREYQIVIEQGHLEELLNYPHWIVSEWNSMLHNNPKLYPHLLEREKFYRTCNMETVAPLPLTKSIISLTTGEEVEWHIKLMQDEILAAYAWTVLDSVIVKVWSLGNISSHLNRYLMQMVYLEPNSQHTQYTQTGIDQWKD